MLGLYTLEQVSHEATYSWFEATTESVDVKRTCISRLPLRALLRHVSPSGTRCFWLSDHKGPSSIMPTCEDVESQLNQEFDAIPNFVLIEGLDWIVNNDGEDTVLQFLQRLDQRCRMGNHVVVFVVDPLVFNARFWSRLHSIAPSVPIPPESDVVSETQFDPLRESEDLERTQSVGQERTLVQLVALPRRGFNKTILTKRMLQWKRMGLDVSDLEPALATENMEKAHEIYAEVESQVKVAVDLCRLLDANKEKLSVTEREIMTFKIMQLSSVGEVEHQLEEILATR